MLLKSTLLLTSALAFFAAVPAYAEGQRVRVGDDSIHIQNGQQDLHIDLKGGGINVNNGGGYEYDDSDDDRNGDRAPDSSRGSSGVDFTNASLTEQNFAGKDMRGANFTNASLDDVSFRNANLQNADFTNAELVDCDFRGANVAGADFTNATFDGSFIKGVDFSGAIMTNVSMEGADRTSFIPTSSESIERSLTAPTANGKPAFINLSITFDFDKADVSAEGLDQIRELARALQSSSLSSASLMIEGHTDSKGSDDYNVDLSKRRAQAIVAVLTRSFDISPARLRAVGYGEMRPVAGNDTDFGRAQNRRVTVINLEK